MVSVLCAYCVEISLIVSAVCTKIVESGKKKQVKVSGPVRLPTKLLKITTRKAPSGNGTATFDRFEMRIHKRIVDLHSSADIVKDITNVTVAPGVEVEITVME